MEKLFRIRSVGLLILFLLSISDAYIFETDDAVVITARSLGGKNGLSRFSPSKDSSISMAELTGRSCMTYDFYRGVCMPVAECYPYTKMHQIIGNLETWVMGTRGTCNYVESNGRQIYGVCCQSSRDNRTLKWDTNSVENTTEYPDVSSRIVGGHSSSNGEYPFMVGVASSGKVYCGGSLLDDIHVLTAAHCVHKLSSHGVAELRIIMGATDLRDNSMIIKRVHSITRHKGFDAVKLFNDIALITLDSPVKFTRTVSPVCLYDDGGVNHDGRQAVAVGWGNLADGGPRAETLQKVTLQIKSQDDCKRSFGLRAPGGIADHFICAYAPGKDSCAGDSGGPLMMNRGNRECQVGIVSWGIGCATNTYGVYTRISSFAIWIERNRIRF